MTVATVRRRRVRRAVDYFAGMNAEQRAVIAHGEGSAVVLAGSGSGKSRAIVHRIARLSRTGEARPGGVLAVTFSRKAAEELTARLRSLSVTSERVGTWHSVCWEILRKERSPFATWEIDTRDRIRQVTKIALGHQGMNWRGADLTFVLQYIGLCKANLYDPGSSESLAFAQELNKAQPGPSSVPELLVQAYLEVSEAQQQRQILTFDDMLVEAVRLLADDEGVRARWSGRWEYIIEDEVQDQSLVQRRLGEMFAEHHRNYMGVGDFAQLIYGFRGASIANVKSMIDRWSPTVYRLGKNYRSGIAIVEAANLLAKNIALSVQMTPERGSTAEMVIERYKDLDAEGEAVASQAMQRYQDGCQWADMAVLYRANSQSRGVEEALIQARVPYVVLGGSNFYERKEVRALLSYIRVASGVADYDDVKRSLSSPFRYLSKSLYQRVEQYGQSCSTGADWVACAREVAELPGVAQLQRVALLEWASLIEGLVDSVAQQKRRELVGTPDVRQHFPAAMLERVLVQTKFVDWLTRDEGAETVENNRVSNVRELVRSSERFTDCASMIAYIDKVIYASRTKVKDKNVVTLMSIHRSKGLEYHVVFFVGANNGWIPHAKSTDPDEERRLFYVAITRARDVLQVSCVRRAAMGSKVVDIKPSMFLDEAGLVLKSVE